MLESHDADTLFQIAGVAQVQRALRCPGRPAADVELVDVPSPTARVVTARIGDVAQGVAAYDRDWVGFRSIEVGPAQRRQGLALAVMAALLEWGAEQGATTAYLQVLGDNAAGARAVRRPGLRHPPRVPLPDARAERPPANRSRARSRSIYPCGGTREA